MNVNGKVALVTGGSRRVGRAIALELAEAGCDLCVHFLRSTSDALNTVDDITSAGRRAAAVRGDLADPQSWPNVIDQTVQSLGRLDILVNNASIFETDRADTLESFDPTLWESMLRINLIAPVALCHHARPHLAKHGIGKIINLCDIAAERPWPSNLAYCSSKAGLVAATKALARAFAPSVQVNGVAPGIAVFPENYSPQQRETLVERVPLRRAGDPSDIAKTVRFLVESGDYITGQILNVDGGRSIV